MVGKTVCLRSEERRCRCSLAGVLTALKMHAGIFAKGASLLRNSIGRAQAALSHAFTRIPFLNKDCKLAGGWRRDGGSKGNSQRSTARELFCCVLQWRTCREVHVWSFFLSCLIKYRAEIRGVGDTASFINSSSGKSFCIVSILGASQGKYILCIYNFLKNPFLYKEATIQRPRPEPDQLLQIIFH